MKWFRTNFDTCFIILQVWVDGLMVLLGCVLGLTTFRWLEAGLFAETTTASYGQVFVLITGITLGCFWAFGLYRWRKSILNVEEYQAVFKAVVASFFVSSTAILFLRKQDGEQEQTNFIYQLLQPFHEMLYLDKNILEYSRVLFLVVFFTIFLVTVLQRGIAFQVLSWFHAKGFGNTNVAVFGTGPMALRIEKKLRLFPTLGYNFVGFLDDDPSRHDEKLRGYPILGGRKDLARLKQAHHIARVFVAAPLMDEDELVDLCSRLEDIGIEYQVVPRLYHFFSRRITVDNLDSVPLITPSEDPVRPFYRLGKRIIDLFAALFVLVFTAPLLLLIAFLVKRESKGPVLFSQIRVGLGGRTFRMLKFRTMFTEMCGDAVSPDSKKDPRITKVGRFLRSSSLDELPQFINVLRGEMSLVGPRPEMPFIVESYSAIDRLRLDAKPGITGLWQVSEARKSPIHENIDYDLYYIENQSIVLDLVIFFLTATAVLRIKTTH
ncbi:MAG: sugar transferase [Planctomycetes bacterium]|nr:sugar transferase [Planctomycetota bacterium]